MTYAFTTEPFEAAVFGAGGGLGAAFVNALSEDPGVTHVHAFSRKDGHARGGVTRHMYDPSTDDGIAKAAGNLPLERLGLVIVTVGTLHDGEHGPEKSIRQLESDRFLDVMRTNAVIPALIAKSVMPQLKKRPMIFAALSARVGSISDNRIGGWHSYRASKAALNMLIRNVAIEAGRMNNEAIAVTLHPGTVDTALSEPFQANVPDGKLFTPDYSATALLDVIRKMTPVQSGKCFDYAGAEITP